MKLELVEKVIMELSPSGKAVVVKIDDQEFYTSKKFVNKLLIGNTKRLKLKKRDPKEFCNINTA